MQASSDDVSFEQWLLRALNDPSLPGVIDLRQCTVLRTRPSCLLTAEELRQLKLALQTNSKLTVLKLDGRNYHDVSLTEDGLKEIVDTIGKLTALQQLDLGGNIFHLILYVRGDVIVVEGAWHAWCWDLFLTRVSDNAFGLEGARALSEPLGKLTALQQLDLSCKIFHLYFTCARGCDCG
jgi:hypothetical protein